MIGNSFKNPCFIQSPITAQKMKFPIKDFFSKCDKFRRILGIWSHLLKKSLMKKFIFLNSPYVWMSSIRFKKL